jgi:4-diphosphocytidyl-2-C-methyl-D-erythritol kinase
MEKIFAPAKINLTLDVLYRRPDGYHEVDMIMQSISLADELDFEASDHIELICDRPALPVDEHNLVWKAVRLLQESFGISYGAKITLRKKIPLAAGLAGGSADAAATLIGLNRFWHLKLKQAQLLQLGIRLGADVPFSILKGTARAEGIGEKLTPIGSRLSGKVLLVTPNINVATPDVYQRLNVAAIKQHPNVSMAIKAVQTGNNEQLGRAWGNVLETAVLPYYPEVERLKAIFINCGVSLCLMSGSGPSVFGLNPSEEQICLVRQQLPSEWFCAVCKLL